MVIVHSYPRLHFSLCDLGSATPRRFGGAGIAIDGLPTVIEASFSGKTNEFRKVDCDARLDLRRVLERLRAETEFADVRLTIRNIPPQHVGLGTKTALLLGVLAAVDRLTKSGLTRVDLQRLSGRGGASGVGINSFFSGGFIVDGGHPREADEEEFAPSGRRSPVAIPPAIVRLPIPGKWRFNLFLPEGRETAGDSERKFFGSNTPVPVHEIREVMGLLIHGVAVAFATANLQLLQSALAAIHKVGFKKREVQNQTSNVIRTLRILQTDYGAAGMSSMGPLLYWVTEAGAFGREALVSLARKNGCQYIGSFAGRNRGFQLVRDLE